jgi:hypothetical protein
MIVQKSRYIRTHVVGGGGIFDTIANIVKRITGNTVGDLASKLLLSAGTSMASEAGKRLASRFIAPSPPLTGLTPPSSSAPEVTAPFPLSAPQAAQQVGSPLTGFSSPPSLTSPQNAVNHQAKLNELMSKYTGSGVVPSLTGFTPTQQRAITIQYLVRKLHQGSGLKVI